MPHEKTAILCLVAPPSCQLEVAKSARLSGCLGCPREWCVPECVRAQLSHASRQARREPAKMAAARLVSLRACAGLRRGGSGSQFVISCCVLLGVSSARVFLREFACALRKRARTRESLSECAYEFYIYHHRRRHSSPRMSFAGRILRPV